MNNFIYLYIVQWGKEKSICRQYNKKTLDTTFYIVDNQHIANLDEIGLVIN